MTRPGRVLVATALVAVALAPSGVAAQGRDAGHGATTGEMLLLLMFVGGAYLLAHFVVDRLQRAFLVVSGLEYIMLGILLGPAVPQIQAFRDLTPLLPLFALAAGWVGLLRGMELEFSLLRDAPRGALRLALGDDLGAGLLVIAAAYALFSSGLAGQVDGKQAWMTAGVLGCCAAAGATGPLDVVKRRYHVEGKLVPILRRASRAGDALALLVFGLLFCVFHEDAAGAPLVLRPTEWAVVSIGLGIVLGLLMSPFLAGDESENSRFLALVGIITFASGAAWFLDLSPLLVNLVLGVVLINAAKGGSQIHATLERTDRPMGLVLMVFAGALWSPPPIEITVAALGTFIGLRWIGKAIGSRAAAWGRDLRPDLYRGLLGHGDVTIAMAVSFRLVYEGPAVDIAYTVILASVVFHDLVAPRVLRSLLVDAGQLRRTQEA